MRVIETWNDGTIRKQAGNREWRRSGLAPLARRTLESVKYYTGRRPER